MEGILSEYRYRLFKIHFLFWDIRIDCFHMVFHQSRNNLRKTFFSHRLLFAILLLLNFIIWCKVSTDIFLVFALFLCLREEEWDKPKEMTIIR